MTAPSLTGLNAVTFNENDVNAAPRLIDSDVIFTDAEEDFAGGRLVVTGLLAEDRVSIESSGSIVFDGSTGEISYNGTVIGVASGGVGGTFEVTFNADATAAGVEAIIEHLTYANTSDTPTAARNLSINVIDTAGESLAEPSFSTSTIVTPPVQIPQPYFADIDADGDLDLIVGAYNELRYFRNDGTSEAPVFTRVTDAGNPLPTLSGVTYVKPELVDIDGDGDLDLMVGVRDGNTGRVRFYRNEGTDSAPVFVEDAANNPLGGVARTTFANLTFGDIDGDGDLDVIFGGRVGLSYMENVGTATAPSFVERTGAASPINGLTTVDFSTPALGDIDNDGDLDLLVGYNGYDLIYFENVGTAQAPAFVQQALYVPVPGMGYMQPTLADIDGDGFLDIAFGNGSGGGIRVTYNNAALPSIPVNVVAQFETTAGDDSVTGDATDDLIEGLDGHDFLDGAAGADTLEGGDGNDYLRGGDGDDIMRGGLGNDAYVVDSLNDVVDETGGDGADLVFTRVSWTLGAGVENLTLTAPGGAIDGTGNALDNVILGNAFANTLRGLDGWDVLSGEGGADTLYGGDGDDTLSGGQGNDWLDGETGRDTMAGGLGNDTYVVDDFTDMILELAGEGTDTIVTDLTGFSLTLHGGVENLTLTGNSLGGEGNAFNNVITGNAIGNLLTGLDGADTLYGMDGDDTLFGGLGADKLHGGTGADTFQFDSAAELDGDRIFDLDFAEGDVIDLGWIDADTNQAGDQSIAFVARFTKVAGQALLSWNAVSNTTFLKIDLNGDGVADVQLSLVGNFSGTKDNLYTGGGDTDGGWVL